MQLPAGPGLPHTRARAAHWLTTAAALAAVTGAAALVQPTNATASPAGDPGAAPDPAAASLPLDCGPHGVLITSRATVDFDGDAQSETVAAARCDAGSGTPPSGLYVLTHPAEAGTAPRVAATLVDPAEGMTVDGVQAGPGTVSVRLLGYSSTGVPRCCPDLERAVTWYWADGALELRVDQASSSV